MIKFNLRDYSNYLLTTDNNQLERSRFDNNATQQHCTNRTERITKQKNWEEKEQKTQNSFPADRQ